MGDAMRKPRVRTVIRSGIWSLERKHRLPSHVRVAARRIFKCRTPALGRHVHVCANGHEHVRWNSCRHRSCPECSWPSKQKWLARTGPRLLACPHHHVVFTFAEELNALWLANVPEMERLLFACASQTIRILFSQRHEGATPGMIAVLHTWGRSLSLHPHLHMVMTRGGVDAAGRWREPKHHHKVVLPVRVVSELFKGKFLAAVRRSLESGRLVLPAGTDARSMHMCIAAAYRKKWCVFIGNAGTRLATIIDYLGRYISGGPIGNGRILALNAGVATFLYRDYRSSATKGRPLERPMILPQVEFLRRRFLHVPLPHSKNVRSYGLYSSSYRGPAPRPLRRRHATDQDQAITVIQAPELKCAECGAPLTLRTVERPAAGRGPPLGRL